MVNKEMIRNEIEMKRRGGRRGKGGVDLSNFNQSHYFGLSKAANYAPFFHHASFYINQYSFMS
jgi:hypothetical protein